MKKVEERNWVKIKTKKEKTTRFFGKKIVKLLNLAVKLQKEC